MKGYRLDSEKENQCLAFAVCDLYHENRNGGVYRAVDHMGIIPMCLIGLLGFLTGPHCNGNVIMSSERECSTRKANGKESTDCSKSLQKSTLKIRCLE